MQQTTNFELIPPKGKAIIYRYFDEGGSYIGSTKHSIKERLDNGYGYLTSARNNKFFKRIMEVGYTHFEVELIEIVDERLRYTRENEYMIIYDSVNNGYNSRYNCIKN